jgi:hypothetical protein
MRGRRYRAPIRWLLIVSAVVVAGILVGVAGARPRELDNCKLITQPELAGILKSPVQIRRGEGLTSCNFFWKGKRLIILSVGPAPIWGFKDVLRQAKPDRNATVTTLAIGGNPAFEIDSHDLGEYGRTIHAYHHDNMLQLTTPPVASKALLPSFAQLRQITAIILTRF